jgi:hypothetical protein
MATAPNKACTRRWGFWRKSQAVFYAFSFFQSDGVPPPAPARVTQTVGQFTQKMGRLKMEIVYQNKVEDFKAFYVYFFKETKQGKALGKRQLFMAQLWIVMLPALSSMLYWSTTDQKSMASRIFITCFLILELIFLVATDFKPFAYAAIQAYKQQILSMTPREFQVFQLSRTITIDNNWLEIRSSESIHRWRWRIVKQIDLTTNFIFIYVDQSAIHVVPKREFSSEEQFIEFGNEIMKLKEKNKDQVLSTE